VVRAGLTPLLCVGELLAEREGGTTREVVVRQLRAGLAPLTPDERADSVIAYEPCWAIGTGRTATPADASAVHAVLREALATMLPKGADIPILYGGSANAGNAASLLAAAGIDGLLVGGASLDPATWAKIVTTEIRR
jgi:triosephosphate isomerase